MTDILKRTSRNVPLEVMTLPPRVQTGNSVPRQKREERRWWVTVSPDKGGSGTPGLIRMKGTRLIKVFTEIPILMRMNGGTRLIQGF